MTTNEDHAPKLMWPSLVVSDESEAVSVETEESFLRMVMDSIDEEWGIVKPDQQPESVVNTLQFLAELLEQSNE